MNRSSLLPALLLTLATTACGPVDSLEDPAGQASLDEAGLLARGSTAGVATGLRLSAASVGGGEILTGTVSGDSGAYVILGFPKTLLAGPRWVRVPQGQRSVTFSLYVNPFVTAPVAATVTARTGAPSPQTFFSQVVTVGPSATPPTTPAPQVLSAVLSPSTVVSGSPSTLTITLSAPAPDVGAALTVNVSNDFYALDADAPHVVLVPAGQTRVAVPVRTHLSSPTATSMDLYVVANSFGGTFQGGILTVNAR